MLQKDTLEVILDGTPKYENVSTDEDAPDDLCEGPPDFEVEMKSVRELYLKMHMVVHFLVQKYAQSDSIKGERGTPCCT